jgi:hypothetical protein
MAKIVGDGRLRPSEDALSIKNTSSHPIKFYQELRNADRLGTYRSLQHTSVEMDV